MFRSSSFHKINADKPLSPFQRRVWFIINRINNSFLPNYMFGNLRKKPFQYDISGEEWDKTQMMASPSRRLSELFFLKLPWDKIEAEIGEIHVVDVGCGKGGMALLLQEFSSGKIKSYTGIDIESRPQWQEMVATHPWIRFHRSSSDDIIKNIPPESNLIISQSALEHFENDLIFFRQIRDFVDSQRSPLVQIHLSTTPACLELYGLHGVRQYTPRSISMIAKLFGKTSYSLVFSLGGEACNRVHMDYIMNPLSAQGVDLRNTKTIEYDRSVKSAIMQDMANNSRNPSFFALVIHSLYNRPMWD